MEKPRARRLLTTWILPVFVAVAFALLCSRYLFQLLLVQGESMAPTYHNLQLTVLDKRDRSYGQGDVIAFRCDALSAVLLKRIVAVPGDSVVIESGTLLVNGALSRVYGAEGLFDFAGILSKPLALAEGEYVVIGDNIAQSKDSRYPEVGIVRDRQIIGKALFDHMPEYR